MEDPVKKTSHFSSVVVTRDNDFCKMDPVRLIGGRWCPHKTD